MRAIIAGTRLIWDYEVVALALEDCPFVEKIKTVVCGDAPGVDQHGKRWARERKIPVELFPADWENNGLVAGHMRNQTMAENADALVAVWDGKSDGTWDMIRRAKARGLEVFVREVTITPRKLGPGEKSYERHGTGR